VLRSTGEHVATLWDYPGQLTCIAFQFAPLEMAREFVRAVCELRWPLI
jgi:hypothetical protein